ncbi:MAG: hypothetical protein PHX87_00945 [Candidatus Peribacteraceae bacterium]|nr:hypothetical protein [Candidatus Peribacteraceae bacterium]MDD5741976.1 hypothetical protein [Candidatus Peribacteraceae bacterium]
MEVTGADGQSSLASKHISVPKLAPTRTREELEPNIQRERQLANGTVQITITTTEADQIATELEKATAETSGDATMAGEKMLVAMNLMPDLGWAEGTIAVEEKLEFGSKIEVALASYLESHERPTSENTMIIVIYGSGQFPDPEFTPQDEYPLPDLQSTTGEGSTLNPQETEVPMPQGMDTLMENIRESYAHSWGFPSGQNASGIPRAVTPLEALDNIKNFIDAELRNNPQIKYFFLGGYSWGGGAVYEISKWLSEAHPEVTLIGAAYVDAIKIGNYQGGEAEDRAPIGAKTILNIFQSSPEENEFFHLNGTPINVPIYVPYDSLDLDASSNNATHQTIDEKAVDYLELYLRQLVES